MMNELLRIDVAGGKYTVIQTDDYNLSALRWGEEWQSLTGNGLVRSLAYELDEARTEIKRLRAVLEIEQREIQRLNPFKLNFPLEYKPIIQIGCEYCNWRGCDGGC